MTQKPKSSPSLKGILKEELREDMSIYAKSLSNDVDLAHKRISENETNVIDKFHSVYARLSDLEKAALDHNDGLNWENVYWIGMVIFAALVYVYFITSKMSE